MNLKSMLNDENYSLFISRTTIPKHKLAVTTKPQDCIGGESMATCITDSGSNS